MATGIISQPIQFMVMTSTLDNVSIGANTAVIENVNITKTGWKPLALTGFVIANASSSGANVSYVTTRSVNVIANSNIASVACRNNGNNAAKIQISISVLYQKI